MVGIQRSRVWWVHRGAGYGGYTEEKFMVGTQRSRVWWVHRGAGYGGYTEEQGMVGTHRSRIWWVHRGAGYGGYTEEQGMVGTHRSRVWWVHRGARYGGYTQEQGMVGTEEEGMVGRDIHLTLNVHRQLVSTEFNTINTVTHSLTLSLALISAPLSSRATTVAVWPFIDER